MATKKSRPRGGATAKRAKSTTRAAARKSKPTPKQKTGTRTANVTKAPKRSVKAAGENKEVAALKTRFQRERNALEKRLTEAMREIGLLRHHEIRAAHLERQLKEREDLILRLQGQLAEVDRRPVEPVYEREVQQSFALATPAQDLDEFEDDQPLGEDGSLAEEDEL